MDESKSNRWCWNGGNTITYGSGDGLQGGTFSFIATILPGDADADGKVNGHHLGVLLGYWGSTTVQTFAQADFNGDGWDKASDLSDILGYWGEDFTVVWIAGDLNNDTLVNAADAALLEQSHLSRR